MNSRLFAYLRLLRLPTVFTALADIFLGFLLTHSTFVSDETLKLHPSFLWLSAASAGIYLSGIVFNDFFGQPHHLWIGASRWFTASCKH